MIDDAKGSENKINSNALHANNCKAFLMPLIPVYQNSKLLQRVISGANDELFQMLQAEITARGSQSDNYPQIFTMMIQLIESQIEMFKTHIQHADVQEFIYLLYYNDNDILSETYAQLKHIPLSQTPSRSRDIKLVTQHMSNAEYHAPGNSADPVRAGKTLSLLRELFNTNYKPQQQTNIPSIRHYNYKRNNPAFTEHRFGTQGQRHENEYRISPIFELWLAVCKLKYKASENEITHLYFNSLRRQGRGLPLVLDEATITKKLHELENRHSNVAVISLPSNGRWFEADSYHHLKPRFDTKQLKHDFLKAAQGKDELHISQAMRARVFGDQQDEILNHLIENSFKAMGCTQEESVSAAQCQALWLHFIKYELTDYLIKKINPNGINFSCKDGIDRAGIASAYYNLISSFQTNNPMSIDEFNEAIIAAPAMVKGRDMNEHFYVLWNTVNHYVNHNGLDIRANPQKQWLIYWRDMNCPRRAVRPSMATRITEIETLLKKEENQAIQSNGLNMLNALKPLYEQHCSDQRLLLELLSRTEVLLTDKESFPEQSEALYQIAQKLNKNPLSTFLAGCIQTFLAAIACVFTCGTSKPYLDSGLAKCRDTFFYKERKTLIAQTDQFIDACNEVAEKPEIRL